MEIFAKPPNVWRSLAAVFNLRVYVESVNKFWWVPASAWFREDCDPRANQRAAIRRDIVFTSAFFFQRACVRKGYPCVSGIRLDYTLHTDIYTSKYVRNVDDGLCFILHS